MQQNVECHGYRLCLCNVLNSKSFSCKIIKCLLLRPLPPHTSLSAPPQVSTTTTPRPHLHPRASICPLHHPASLIPVTTTSPSLHITNNTRPLQHHHTSSSSPHILRRHHPSLSAITARHVPTTARPSLAPSPPRLSQTRTEHPHHVRGIIAKRHPRRATACLQKIYE